MRPHDCPSSRHFLASAALALGLICHHALSISAATSLSKDAVQTKWRGDRALLWTTRDLSATPGQPLSEQAFASTFRDNYADGIGHVLEQHAQLVRWVEATSNPPAASSSQSSPSTSSQLAFIPELGMETALAAMRAGVALSKMDIKKPDAIAAALRSIRQQLASASPWFGFPATRRLLIGALLKKRVEFGGTLPSSLQPAVDDLLTQLFSLHKASVANRGAVQFFHISKSGGTNLCQAAEANGCASQGFDTKTNCLIRDFFDQPRWVTNTAHKYVQYRMSSRQSLPWFVNFHTFRPPFTCEQRRAYLLRENLTFYANEYTNPPGAAGASSEMCPDFVNLIMFRHPHDRLRSQIGWVQKLYKEYYLDVDTQQAFVNRTTGFWERLMPAGVNNYYIRSLLGQRFFEYPVLPIAPEHITLAKLASLQHDLLLTLEAMDRNDLALRAGLGWAQSLRQGAVRSSTELGDAVSLPLDFDDMLERNAPDVEVFAFAREMQALDTVLWSFAAAAGLAQAAPAAPAAAAAAAAAAGQLQAAGTSGIAEAASGHCGYVSDGSPAAAAELAARLRNVVVPASTLRPGASPAAVAAAAAAAAAAAGTVTNSSSASGGDGASGAGPRSASSSAGMLRAGGVSSSGSTGVVRTPTVTIGLGAGHGAKATGTSSRGAAVVTLARHRSRQLQRLKRLPAIGRSRLQQLQQRQQQQQQQQQQ